MSSRFTAYAIAITMAHGAVAANAACAPLNNPQVSVEVSAVPVETAFDVSLEQLRELALAAGKRAHMPLRAVYASKLMFGAAIKSEVSPISPRELCVVHLRVTVRIDIVARTIHGARELREQKCLETAAIAHAMAHARHQEKSIREARDIIAEDLRELLRGPLPPAGSDAEAERTLSRAISAHIDAELAKIDSDRAPSARAIDSPEALSQLSGGCEPENPKPDAQRM